MLRMQIRYHLRIWQTVEYAHKEYGVGSGGFWSYLRQAQFMRLKQDAYVTNMEPAPFMSATKAWYIEYPCVVLRQETLYT
eukprot:708031-Pleurochrysis_carterae.AAC.1